jgi:hypothetical protein
VLNTLRYHCAGYFPQALVFPRVLQVLNALRHHCAGHAELRLYETHEHMC